MPTIHPKARTTPAVRAEIAHSSEATGVLAQRYGVSTETIRKWRQRGAADCQDHSRRPHKLPWKAPEEERAIVCALRRATGFPLDDLTFVVSHFLPHLNRDAVYRILKAEGLGRLPPADRSRRSHSRFKDYDLGFVHVDVKHLPKLRTADGQSRKRYLLWRSTAPPGLSIWRSRTTKPSAAPSPSSKRPSRPSPSRSPMC
jgi:transposase